MHNVYSGTQWEYLLLRRYTFVQSIYSYHSRRADQDKIKSSLCVASTPLTVMLQGGALQLSKDLRMDAIFFRFITFKGGKV